MPILHFCMYTVQFLSCYLNLITVMLLQVSQMLGFLLQLSFQNVISLNIISYFLSHGTGLVVKMIS